MSEEKHKEHHSAHHEHKEAKGISAMNWNNFALVIVLVFVAALVATWAGFSAGAATGTSVSVDKTALGSTVENYINTNLITDSTVSAKIVDVNSLPNGLSELKYEIYQNGAKVSAGSVFTSGDKLIVGQAFDLSAPPAKIVQEPVVEAEAVKSDKPKVDLYVMSFCPFGNKAEDTFVPVYGLLKDKVDFNVHFIVSVAGDNVQSLHGAPEAIQDQREACVAKYNGNVAWLNFAAAVNKDCGSSGTCWEAAAVATGLDVNAINSCVAEEGIALMQANDDASTAAGANGSPTMVINGVKTNIVYQYGNSEAYKQAICSAFNNAPSECSVALSANTATGQGGVCG